MFYNGRWVGCVVRLRSNPIDDLFDYTYRPSTKHGVVVGWGFFVDFFYWGGGGGGAKINFCTPHTNSTTTIAATTFSKFRYKT